MSAVSSKRERTIPIDNWGDCRGKSQARRRHRAPSGYRLDECAGSPIASPVPRHADDGKGQAASGSNREGESTEARRRGGAAPQSVPATTFPRPELRNRWFADSLLEEDGFEPSVPPSGRAQLDEAQQFRYCPYRRILVNRDHLPAREKRARGTRRRSSGSTQMRGSPRDALSRKSRELAAWRGSAAGARPARSGPEWRRGCRRSGRQANLGWRAYPLQADTRE